jgi:electron transfer flavoprotein alpha subunit
MAGVWVLAEHRDQALELLNIGQDLAGKSGNKLLAFLGQNPELAQDYINHGADEVVILPALPSGQSLADYVPLIAAAAAEEKPDIFLISATQRGKEMAARIAARLHTGLCSECSSIEYLPDKKVLQMRRLMYGGAAVQTLICTTRPQMATIAPRTFSPAAEQSGRQGTIRELPAAPAGKVRVMEKRPQAAASADLSQAMVVIAVGRGVEKAEDLTLARELAELIGAQIGCTRPVSEELHWLPEDTCIGLSGKVIKPDIYIGIGISGQIQHMVGIRDAKVICALNSDENAPIFDSANYGIVGDLYQTLPALIKELRK